MLRPALIPAAGKQFVVADWSAVEARVTAWASADPQAEDVLQVFRDGRDIYKREAAGIYRVPEDSVDKDQRQIGKVAILSLGFGGSIGAFSAMGRNYGVIMPESDSRRIVDAWRRANAWAVRYWGKLEDAYTRALRNPGREFSAGRVTYLYDKQHLWYALPSGRILCYPFAKFEGDEITYVKAAWKPAARPGDGTHRRAETATRPPRRGSGR
jgi:DNA polymerase